MALLAGHTAAQPKHPCGLTAKRIAGIQKLVSRCRNGEDTGCHAQATQEALRNAMPGRVLTQGSVVRG